MATTAPIRIDVHLTPEALGRALREEAHQGLTASPKWLSAKWHYDDEGSRLFEQITQLEEYYPTRAERSILERRAAEIAELSGADTLIELGSGFSHKTRLLLDAFAAAGSLRRFVPFDVSEDALREAGERIAEAYPGLAVHGIVGDFELHLGLLPDEGRRLVAFLGGTIGNLPPAQRALVLERIAGRLDPGESLLLGADLVKDPDRIQCAYDDAAGVTAAFSKNVLAVLNRVLDADFDLGRFRHDARWDAERDWMDMGLVSLADQRVRVRGIDLEVDLAEGERIHTEISAKFRREGLERELWHAGFDPARFWTDPAGDFSLTLARRR